MHTYPALSLAAGVEQGGLKAHLPTVLQVLVDGHLHAEAGVRVHVRQRQQVRGSDKKVAVEGVQGHAARAPDPHHRFKPDLSGEVAPERFVKLFRHGQIFVAVVADERGHLASGELGYS